MRTEQTVYNRWEHQVVQIGAEPSFGGVHVGFGYARARGIRVVIAVWVGKLIVWLTRKLRMGGGTALPGKVASRIAPGLIRALSEQLPYGVVVVTGTNGKTTTARILTSLLDRSGYRVATNRSGANLKSGVATALLVAATPSGRLPFDIGVLEVDERSVPRVLAELTPRALAVTNLFRDQLDRTGDPAQIEQVLRRVVLALTSPSVLVLNADDPLVAGLGRGVPVQSFMFGVGDALVASKRDVMPEAAPCPQCGQGLTYTHLHYAHLGHYRCEACGVIRPHPDVEVVGMTPLGNRADAFALSVRFGSAEPVTVPMYLPGTYNIYNALAALSVAYALGVDVITKPLEIGGELAAFGRMERVQSGSKQLLLSLIKNPAGAHETLETIFRTGHVSHLLMALNDAEADGEDVSWIWDVHLEQFTGFLDLSHVTVSGSRAEELALRLKYAGMTAAPLAVEPDIQAALDLAIAQVPANETLYVLANYTAMLQLRGALQQAGLVAPFWEA